MRKAGYLSNHQLEKTIQEIIQSKAQSKIYLFLLRKSHVKTEDIVKGTHLHPSTVREALVSMYNNHLIHREIIKNDSIGKNPYVYSPLPPILLIKNYLEELEYRFNSLVTLSKKQQKQKQTPAIQIKIIKKEEIH